MTPGQVYGTSKFLGNSWFFVENATIQQENTPIFENYLHWPNFRATAIS